MNPTSRYDFVKNIFVSSEDRVIPVEVSDAETIVITD
jgi:hypothetical protein